MLDAAEKTVLLKLARETLQAYLSGDEAPVCQNPTASLLERKGAFVSLHRGEELRGCIGQLLPDRELYKIVQHCVLSAPWRTPALSRSVREK
jgi:AMMECR1 domain-containing protein